MDSTATRDVRPALKFLGIFLGGYLILSLLYGIWIESLGSKPDGMTILVSRQVAWILQKTGYAASMEQNPAGPTVILFNEGRKVLNVFEGCNGLNVMIVFSCFLFAFGGKAGKIAWFMISGWIIIHLANLARILALFWLSGNDRLFYYFHKYFFTAAIYVIVFLLWGWWIMNAKQRESTHDH